ncbi:hypothetical protein K461DRAFT_107808 [Myriangium duriaei CBS 260.36]|uniref:Uncharacterized protein n=1 Tax=Myriangium duriaei CBS 260.36 TaxID=1168546 RepID=A0A9P4J9V9_9PEZI|nr:hypothetical protein K461DRAFT_107808 [Myriangium duriaei CBS 260.36]
MRASSQIPRLPTAPRHPRPASFLFRFVACVISLLPLRQCLTSTTARTRCSLPTPHKQGRSVCRPDHDCDKAAAQYTRSYSCISPARVLVLVINKAHATVREASCENPCDEHISKATSLRPSYTSLSIRVEETSSRQETKRQGLHLIIAAQLQ